VRVKLKVAFIEDGRSQRQIGAACGIAENRLSGIVRGWAKPDAREEQAIAKALGKNAAELFESAVPIDEPPSAAPAQETGA
jgi:transcriptional regulator with XRE-family HTH domain